MASCDVCKQEMPDDALFCPQCGYSAKLRRNAAETKAPTSTTTVNRAAIRVASTHPTALLFISMAFKVLAAVYFVLGSIWILIQVTKSPPQPILVAFWFATGSANAFTAWVSAETYLLLVCMMIAFFGYVLSLLMEIASNTSR